MNRFKAAFSSLLLLCAGCGTPDPEPGAGSALETAVVIQEKTEITGISAEYDWIHENYPGWRPAGQKVVNRDGRVYDLLNLKGPGDRGTSIYFDITNFYGNM